MKVLVLLACLCACSAQYLLTTSRNLRSSHNAPSIQNLGGSSRITISGKSNHGSSFSSGYIPERADTVTSYITVTATPIAVVTASRGVVPTRAVTTEYTSFVTSVTDVELWQTVTHTFTQFQGYTEAVYETQELKQLHTVT